MGNKAKGRKSILKITNVNKIPRGMTMKIGEWMRQKRTKSRKYPRQENTGRKIGTPFKNDDTYSKENYKDHQGHKDTSG